eukprot:TRINITY_DN65010_c0_g1_i1.p1 TRINITY_DN65010_c0_g1~~TRINITY_DN65010_c0_g1_i1.p1  ORF type:complete len:327 (-),score=45.93 TRINITY_DN65010_c0_g1_i1:37-1017(-)
MRVDLPSFGNGDIYDPNLPYSLCAEGNGHACLTRSGFEDASKSKCIIVTTRKSNYCDKDNFYFKFEEKERYVGLIYKEGELRLWFNSCYVLPLKRVIVRDLSGHIVLDQKWVDKSDEASWKVLLLSESEVMKQSNYIIIELQLSKIEEQLDPEVELTSLGSDLMKMLNSEHLSDCVVACGNTEFKAHKLILSARSEVFQAMFNTEMKEKNTSRVEIQDFEPEAVKALLDYLYSEKVNNLDDIASSLLPVAHMYRITPLQSLCAKTLEKKMCIDNAVDNLLLFDKYFQPRKVQAFKFIRENWAQIKKQNGVKEKLDQVQGVFEFLSI